jgi:hypothetical protein
MKKNIAFICFILILSANLVLADNTATQTITITVEPIAVIGFKDTNSNQAYLVINKDAEIQTEQKELGLTTTLSGLSICAQVTEQPENPSYEIEVVAENINFKGACGNFLGLVSINDIKPTQLIYGIGPGYGFYSIDYIAKETKKANQLENYTITFTLTDD